MNGVADLGTLVVRMTGDNSSFDAGMLMSVARIAGFTAAVVGMAGAVTAVLNKVTRDFAAFDSAMTKSLAIMGDVSQQTRGRMEKLALQMSTESLSSAKDLAEGYYFLASAGLDAEQSMKALSVAQQFSVAGDMKLALATDSLVDSVVGLGLASQDATRYQMNMVRVSDVLVKAGADSTTTVEQLATALRTKAAGAFRMVGYEVEQGVALLETFAKVGVKGENAGEQANIVIRDLMRAHILFRMEWERLGVSVFDGNGRMRDMGVILRQLEKAFSGMSTEARKNAMMSLGFQERTVSATNSLMGLSGAYEEFLKKNKEASGFTDQVAKKQMSSYAAQVKLTENAINKLSIEIGEGINPAMYALNLAVRDGAQDMSRYVAELRSTGDASQVLGIAAAAAAAPLITLYMAARVAWEVFKDLGRVVGLFVSTLLIAANLMAGSVRTAFELLRGVISMVSAVLSVLIIQFMLWGAKAANAVREAVNAFDQMHAKVMRSKPPPPLELIDVSSLESQLAEAKAAVGSGVRDISKEIAGIAAETDSVNKKLLAFNAEMIGGLRESAWNIFKIGYDGFSRLYKMMGDVAARQAEISAKSGGMSVANTNNAGLNWMSAWSDWMAKLRESALGLEQSFTLVAADVAYPFEQAVPKLRQYASAIEGAQRHHAALKLALSLGVITQDEFNERLSQGVLTSTQLSYGLATLPTGLDAYRSSTAQAANELVKLNYANEQNAALTKEVNRLAKDTNMSEENRERILNKLTLSQSEYNEARAKFISQNNEFLGQRFGMPGVAPAAKFGSGVFDYTQGAPETGIQGVDSSNALLVEEERQRVSYQRQQDELEAHYREMGLTTQEYEQAQQQMKTNYARRTQELTRQQNQIAMDSAISISESLVSIAGDLAGKQSDTYKTMFAISKAFAIADSVIKISQGIAAAAANPWPANLAAMAQVAAATSSIVSNIMAVKMTSFEGGGMTPMGARSGGVDGRGGMLSVLHPNEMVVDLESPKNRGGALNGQSPVTVNVYNQASGTEAEVQQSADGKTLNILIRKVKQEIAGDISSGRGDIPKAIQSSFGLSRGARG